MKIGTKITIGFFISIILMAFLLFYTLTISQNELIKSIGNYTTFLARDILFSIVNRIDDKIQEIKKYSLDRELQDILKDSNEYYETNQDQLQYILEMEKDVEKAQKDMQIIFMKNLLSNRLSRSLQLNFIKYYETEYGYTIFGDVLVTNRFGINIAQTQEIYHFSQANKLWWQKAKEDTIFIGEPECNENSQTNRIIISIKINDNDNCFIGVIKVSVVISRIIQIEGIMHKKYQTTEMKLITDSGNLIFSTLPFRFFEDITGEDFYKKIKDENTFFYASERGRKKLFSYVHSSTFSNLKDFHWILFIAHDESEILKPVYTLGLNIVITYFIIIIVCLVVSLFVSQSISKPIIKLQKGTEMIGSGNFDYRVDNSGDDEIADLSRAFNTMTSKMSLNLKKLKKNMDELNREIQERKKAEKRLKKSQAQLVQAEKMSALGTLTAGIAHEMNNPLMSILNYIQYCIKNSPEKDKIHTILKDSEGEIKKCISVIMNLLTFSRMDVEGDEGFEHMKVETLIKGVLKLLDYKLSVENISVNVDILDHDLTLKIKVNSIQQVILNLLTNAIDALKGGKEKKIDILVRKNKNGVLITIKDNGCGIPEEDMNNIFDPYFTKKKPGEGTGLGLSICRSIIKVHNGSINCTSRMGVGTKFTVVLPYDE